MRNTPLFTAVAAATLLSGQSAVAAPVGNSMTLATDTSIGAPSPAGVGLGSYTGGFDDATQALVVAGGQETSFPSLDSSALVSSTVIYFGTIDGLVWTSNGNGETVTTACVPSGPVDLCATVFPLGPSTQEGLGTFTANVCTGGSWVMGQLPSGATITSDLTPTATDGPGCATPVPTAATPVPTSPLWLLGIMAGLLSLK